MQINNLAETTENQGSLLMCAMQAPGYPAFRKSNTRWASLGSSDHPTDALRPTEEDREVRRAAEQGMSRIHEQLKYFRGARRWVSELAGLPTYLGAMLLISSTVRSFAVGTMIFLSVVMAYHVTYSYLFPEFEFRDRKTRLAGLVVAQVALWLGLMLVVRGR